MDVRPAMAAQAAMQAPCLAAHAATAEETPKPNVKTPKTTPADAKHAAAAALQPLWHVPYTARPATGPAEVGVTIRVMRSAMRAKRILGPACSMRKKQSAIPTCQSVSSSAATHAEALLALCALSLSAAVVRNHDYICRCLLFVLTLFSRQLLSVVEGWACTVGSLMLRITARC
jgi:hypothetical protein